MCQISCVVSVLLSQVITNTTRGHREIINGIPLRASSESRGDISAG